MQEKLKNTEKELALRERILELKRKEKDYDDEEDEDLIQDDLSSIGSDDEREKMSRLPSVDDPKLWRVRVKKGFERIAAMSLMAK